MPRYSTVEQPGVWEEEEDEDVLYWDTKLRKKRKPRLITHHAGQHQRCRNKPTLNL